METDKKPANLPLSFVDWLKANPYVDCPITQYNKYLISHHLTVLAERIERKLPTKLMGKSRFNAYKEYDNSLIQKILEDYKKEIGV